MESTTGHHGTIGDMVITKMIMMMMLRSFYILQWMIKAHSDGAETRVRQFLEDFFLFKEVEFSSLIEMFK